jgi:hypothetical protein
MRLAAAGALLASAAFFSTSAAAAAATPPKAAAAAAPAADTTIITPKAAQHTEPVRVLDVPFVPQSEALCGGASLAMVLRWWGEPQVQAEEFSSLVTRGEGAAAGASGIRGDSLVAAVERRGWSAFPIEATRADVRDHLARGRPLIARIDTGSKVAHYVVLLGWTTGGVVYHDPAVAPFQVETEQEFARSWSAAGRWALLVLPPRDRVGWGSAGTAGGGTAGTAGSGSTGDGSSVLPPPPPPDTTGFDAPAIPDIAGRAPISGCDSLVSEGVRRARRGADAEAAGLLGAAASLCPTNPSPVRELAGLKYRNKDYRAASFMAQRALVLDPNDTYTWRLLASSRYLTGDVKGALDAWNRLSEPKADLTRVDGLHRTRYEAVADQVDLDPEYLLTWNEYRHAERRLDELPAATDARLRLVPLPQGSAQVNVAVVERPLFFEGRHDVLVAVARAAANYELSLRVSSPFHLGETWTARWRFQQNRNRVALGLDAPAVGGWPGLWHVEGMWEQQTYSDPELPANVRFRQERQRGGISFADWLAPDWRVELGMALDRFEPDSGATAPTLFSPHAVVDARSMGDHLSLRTSGAIWTRSGSSSLLAGDFLARYGSDDYVSGDWLARVGVTAVSEDAPLALWPGAGTGSGRDALLRAHPLLDGGILQGLMFGRDLLHGGVERRFFKWRVNTTRLGFALFVDAARVWRPIVDRDIPTQVDVGGGLRMVSGRHEEVRADAAYGLQDQEFAISVRYVTH